MINLYQSNYYLFMNYLTGLSWRTTPPVTAAATATSLPPAVPPLTLVESSIDHSNEEPTTESVETDGQSQSASVCRLCFQEEKSKSK